MSVSQTPFLITRWKHIRQRNAARRRMCKLWRQFRVWFLPSTSKTGRDVVGQCQAVALIHWHASQEHSTGVLSGTLSAGSGPSQATSQRCHSESDSHRADWSVLPWALSQSGTAIWRCSSCTLSVTMTLVALLPASRVSETKPAVMLPVRCKGPGAKESAPPERGYLERLPRARLATQPGMERSVWSPEAFFSVRPDPTTQGAVTGLHGRYNIGTVFRLLFRRLR
ncbi:hypothetical protein VTK56DRAFT_9191 [Thermocarpiscus australiensis]